MASIRAAAASCAGFGAVAAAVGVSEARLHDLLEERPRLREAFDRGRLLRDFERLAGYGATYEEVAAAMEMSCAQVQRLIHDDPELDELWRAARVKTLQEMLAAQKLAAIGRPARDGEKATPPSQVAIKAVLDRLTPDARSDARNPRAMGVNETADVMGVSRQTLHAWSTEGECPRNADGTYPLRELIEWRYRQRLAQAGGGQKPDHDRRYRTVKADIAEMELRRALGDLLERQAVVAGLVARVAAICKELGEASAIGLVAECQGKPAARMAEIVRARFDRIRRGLIGGRLSEVRLSEDIEQDLRRLLAKLAAAGGPTT